MAGTEARRFGKYEVVEKIGEGGFGTVFRGRDPILKRFVAIKTCTTDSGELRERFSREAEIAASLQHPHITTVFDFGSEDGVPYLVQEYLSGEDLDHKIGRRDPLSTGERLRLLIQIADGLRYAHAHGVVHRDIKPANIRVLDSGQTKIMDFGIAKLLTAENQLTRTGMTMGTAGYLPPEQIRGEPVDLRADMFSFGVLAFELLTYRRPFEGDSLSAVLYRIVNAPTPPLPEIWPDCPPLLAGCIARCLAKSPADRYADMTPVINELELCFGAAATMNAAAGTGARSPLAAVSGGAAAGAPATPHPGAAASTPYPGGAPGTPAGAATEAAADPDAPTRLLRPSEAGEAAPVTLPAATGRTLPVPRSHAPVAPATPAIVHPAPPGAGSDGASSHSYNTMTKSPRRAGWLVAAALVLLAVALAWWYRSGHSAAGGPEVAASNAGPSATAPGDAGTAAGGHPAGAAAPAGQPGAQTGAGAAGSGTGTSSAGSSGGVTGSQRTAGDSAAAGGQGSSGAAGAPGVPSGMGAPSSRSPSNATPAGGTAGGTAAAGESGWKSGSSQAGSAGSQGAATSRVAASGGEAIVQPAGSGGGGSVASGSALPTPTGRLRAVPERVVGVPTVAPRYVPPPPTAPPPGHCMLVIFTGNEEAGTAAAESAFAEKVSRTGVCVQSLRHDEPGRAAAAGGEPRRLATIARNHSADVVVIGSVQSDAQPAMGPFFTGRALLTLTTFEVATGQYREHGDVEVGGSGEPGKAEPTAATARIAASREAGKRGAEKAVKLGWAGHSGGVSRLQPPPGPPFLAPPPGALAPPPRAAYVAPRAGYPPPRTVVKRCPEHTPGCPPAKKRPPVPPAPSRVSACWPRFTDPAAEIR
jgi:hypothetical protein